jgi:hypothetical protein
MNCPDCNKEITENGIYAFPACKHSYGKYNVYYVAASDEDFWINIWAAARWITAVYKWAKLSEERIEERINALELLR